MGLGNKERVSGRETNIRRDVKKGEHDPKRDGEGGLKDFGKVMYTLLYLKWITNKNLLYSTWSSAQCYVPAWVGEGLGEMDTCMCMAEPLHCSLEKVTALLIGSTLIQNVSDV